MYIFLDESGSFAIRNKVAGKNINCVVAIVMTEEAYTKWKSRYSDLSKASDIKEAKEAQEIVNFLVEIGAKAFVVLIDLSKYEGKEFIESHKIDYINSIIEAFRYKGLDGSRLVSELNELSSVDYMKVCLFVRLLSNVIRGILSIEHPLDDIKNLIWCSDLLNIRQQRIIKQLLIVDLSERSKINPIRIYENNIVNYRSPCGRYIDISKLIQSYSFFSEEQEVGIKAADCVANFLRREALFNNLFAKSPSILENVYELFSLPDSRDTTHFDKNELFIDIEGVDYFSDFMFSFFNYEDFKFFHAK